MPTGTPKHVDWDVVIFYLEQGFQVKEIKEMIGYGNGGYWPVRARKEMSPEKFDRYTRLAKSNRHFAFDSGQPRGCGTAAGYDAHHSRGDLPACQPCKTAKTKQVNLLNWHKQMEGAMIEYKVDSRWSPKWKQQVYVVERHNSNARNPRLIAVYTEAERARDACQLLNQGIGDER